MPPTRGSARKLTAVLVLGVAYAAVAGVAPALAGSPRRAAQATQRLVILERAHDARARPDRSGPRVATLHRRRPITGARTTLPVLQATTAADGRRWLRVLLPGRPNGRTGWITSDATSFARTIWRLRIKTSTRQVTVLRRGRVLRRFKAVVGKSSTPTPTGRFFVEETVRLGPGRTGAPFALALSARSEVLAQFDGGPGQIALHGLGGIGGVPGAAASHGCLRLDRRSISWLAARIGAGVPVTITR